MSAKKKILTNVTHRIVQAFFAENFFYTLSKYWAIFRKFIPTPDMYTNSNFVQVKRNNLMIKIDRSDYMQWSVYAGEDDFSFHFMNKYRLKEHPVILDIGSNFGAFTLNTAKMLVDTEEKFHVHAFEPNNESFENFRQNIQLNQYLKDFITVHPIGIGKEKALFSMVSSSSNSGAAHLVEEGSGEGAVEVIDLDSWVLQHDLMGQVAFAKIDVEGWEMDVLLGGKNALLENKVPLYCEVTDGWLQKRGYSETALLNLLYDFGYQVFLDERGRLKKLNSPEKNYGLQYNIIAI